MENMLNISVMIIFWFYYGMYCIIIICFFTILFYSIYGRTCKEGMGNFFLYKSAVSLIAVLFKNTAIRNIYSNPLEVYLEDADRYSL